METKIKKITNTILDLIDVLSLIDEKEAIDSFKLIIKICEGKTSQNLVDIDRISVRLLNILLRNNKFKIVTLSDAAKLSYKDFMCIKNAGKKSLSELNTILIKFGYKEIKPL